MVPYALSRFIGIQLTNSYALHFQNWSFTIKNPLPVFLAADWNFAYENMQLSHGQASYGEANYNIRNYCFCVDDHTPKAIK